jgi:hypothetical protein
MQKIKKASSCINLCSPSCQSREWGKNYCNEWQLFLISQFFKLLPLLFIGIVSNWQLHLMSEPLMDQNPNWNLINLMQMVTNNAYIKLVPKMSPVYYTIRTITTITHITLAWLSQLSYYYNYHNYHTITIIIPFHISAITNITLSWLSQLSYYHTFHAITTITTIMTIKQNNYILYC